MKLCLVFLFLAASAIAMDVRWNQDMLDAVTLLQGTGRDGYIDLQKIRELATLLITAKNNKRHVVSLHNSPYHLLVTLSTFTMSQEIFDYLRPFKAQEYFIETKDNSIEMRYSFAVSNVDVVWLADQVNKKWNINAHASPLFTPKIKLEHGPAGSDEIHMTFINIDQHKEHLYTFKDKKIIGSGERLLT